MGTDPPREGCDSRRTVHCCRPDPPLTPYTKDISKRPMTLTTLTFAQLESLWCDCQVSGDYEQQDRLLSEMLTREDACPQDYDLMWEMQDCGWNGGVTQEDVDAR